MIVFEGKHSKADETLMLVINGVSTDSRAMLKSPFGVCKLARLGRSAPLLFLCPPAVPQSAEIGDTGNICPVFCHSRAAGAAGSADSNLINVNKPRVSEDKPEITLQARLI